MPPSKKTKSSKASNNTSEEAEKAVENETSDESYNESHNLITKSQLDIIIRDIRSTIKSEFSSLKNEIIRLQTELESTTDVANNATKLAEQLKKECTQLKEENTNIKYKLQHIVNEQNKVLEVVEDSKNWSLWKTLVFRGIPEQKFNTEGGANGMRSENWDDTATILATSISDKLSITVEEAQSMVERCHQGAPNPRYKGNAPHPIFAAFVDWRHSKRTKEAYRKSNVEERSTQYVENKFGPQTTVRRNLALQERKKLIESGTIYNGYVSHPARLMVKDSKAKGAKYKLWNGYSKEPVKFNR